MLFNVILFLGEFSLFNKLICLTNTNFSAFPPELFLTVKNILLVSFAITSNNRLIFLLHTCINTLACVKAE